MQNRSPRHLITRRLALWASVCATVTLAACSTMTPSTPEAQVKLRASERWKHLLAKDFNKAYAYSTPAFRTVIPEKDYSARFGPAVVWVSTEVATVNCPEAAKCIAKVRLDYLTVHNRNKENPYSTYFNETWLLEDGQWWLFQNLKGD